MKRFLFIISLLLLVSFAAEDSLRIQNQQTIPASIRTGDQNVLVQFDLYHAGQVTYSNITITLQLPQQFEPIKITYTLDKLSSGQTATASFRVNVKQNIDPGTYTIPVLISYVDTSGPYQTSTNRQIYISISSTPKLKFIDISFSPTPHIGKYFDAIFTVNNTGALPASNILAAISVASTAQVTWIPDSQIVDYIAASDTGKIIFRGLMSSETAPGAYKGTLNLTYSNNTLSNAFYLEVHGTPELKLAGSQTDKTPYVGDKFTLSVQLEDIGKEKARSAQVTLKDASISGTTASFIGTIDPDDTGSAIFDITLSKGGSYTIPLEITYLDDEGNTYTTSENITIFVYSKPFDFTGLIIFVILAGGAWYWYSKKQRKRHISKIVD
jgi:hypothetical protein